MPWNDIVLVRAMHKELNRIKQKVNNGDHGKYTFAEREMIIHGINMSIDAIHRYSNDEEWRKANDLPL